MSLTLGEAEGADARFDVADDSDAVFFQCLRENGRTETIQIDETDLRAVNLSYTKPFATNLEVKPNEYVFQFAYRRARTYRYRFHRATGEGTHETLDEKGRVEQGAERISCTQVPREGLVIAR
jgi:hypothetical protein